MPISLSKGQKFSLNKGNASAVRFIVGFGWNVELSKGTLPDIDISAFMLNTTGKVSTTKEFIFYGNLSHISQAVVHNGNKAANGDRVSIAVDFGKMPGSVSKIAFTATIYDAETKNQSFTQIKNAYIRFVNEATNEEVLRYTVTDNFTNETCLVFGELYKNNSEWKFNAMGSSKTGGLAALCGLYGVEVG